MMQKKRFYPFVFGVLIGILFLIFVFKNRNFDFLTHSLPSNRVIHNLKQKKINSAILLPPEYQNFLTKKTLHAFLDHAHVNFSKSESHKEPCAEYNLTNDTISLQIKNCKESLYIMSISTLKP